MFKILGSNLLFKLKNGMGKIQILSCQSLSFFHITKDIVDSLDKAIVLLFKVLSV